MDALSADRVDGVAEAAACDSAVPAVGVVEVGILRSEEHHGVRVGLRDGLYVIDYLSVREDACGALESCWLNQHG